MNGKILYPRPCECCDVPCILENKSLYYYHTKLSKKARKKKEDIMTDTTEQKMINDDDYDYEVGDNEGLVLKEQKIEDVKETKRIEEAEQWLKITVPILKKLCIDDVGNKAFGEQLMLLKVKEII